MAQLAAIVDTLESIPEAVRGFYKQVDDKFVLDADVEGHPQVQGLRNAYKADHEKVKLLGSEMARYKDVDPDRWATLKDLKDEDLHAFETWRVEQTRKPNGGNGAGNTLDFEAEIERRIAPMKTSHQREIEKREQLLQQVQVERDNLTKEMKQRSIATSLMAGCAEAGVLPGAVEEIVLLGQRYFRINETDEVIAVDRSGADIFGADGKQMRAKEWILTRGTDKAHWFPLNSGGGANGGRFNMVNGYAVNTKKDFKDLKARVEFIKNNGREAYENLPES